MRFAALLFTLTLACTAFAVSPDGLLEPEKAFRISARAIDERNVEVEFKIAEGYYMYRDRFSFATESGEPLGEAEIPRGVLKVDPFFGKTETFRDLVRIRVPVSPQEMAKGSLNLKVTSQGCSDKGVCYVPLEQTVRVSLPSAGDAAPRTATAAPMQAPWLLLAASLAGTLLLGWASAGAPSPGERTARLSIPAVLVWGFALGAAGTLAGWLGSIVQATWLQPASALIFVALAAFWMHWSMHRGEFNRPVRATRDAAFLGAVLLLSVHLGDAWFGGAAALGAGMASGLFPKARTEGEHPAALQAVALAMLAAGAWIGSPLLPDVFRMLAWAVWLIVAAMLLRAIDPLPESAPWLLRLGKAAGVGLLVWGVAVAIGAMSGARDPLRPFEALSGATSARRAVEPIRFERVTTLAELESRIASARRPVMVDFYADWCVSCKEMEQFTFSDAQVRARMQRMLLLQVDVTRNTAEDKAILQRFRLFGPPGIVFFDARGQELRQRVIGYQPPERFLRVLDAVLAEEST